MTQQAPFFKADVIQKWKQHDWARSSQPYNVWYAIQRCIAGLSLLLLSPLFLVLFVAVKLNSRGPFIYKQSRPGFKGKTFTAYKIRTMSVGADKDLSRARQVSKDDPMVTGIGKILRDLKIDELPQLFNVLKGEMALVGPRPIAQSLQEELEGKIPGFSRRLNVLPGLTSLGQVCIFDNAGAEHVVDDWSTRFEAELDYLHKHSWRYDIAIIGLTCLFIFKKVARKVPKYVKPLALCIIFVFLAACSERLATRPFNEADTAYEKDIRAYGDRIDPALVEIEPVAIDVEASEFEDPVYRVGSGDALSINVFGEEGLDDLLVQVDGDGFIQLPFLETVNVAGRSLKEIQTVLKAGFAKQFRNPWVVVNMASHKSRPVYLLGQFNNPGVIYLDGPTNLMQAVSLGRGLSEAAYLRGARLWRNGDIAAVDLKALLMEGKAEHNITLRAGDTLVVPSARDNKAFVMGAVVRAGAVPFSNEPMTLLKALTQVGGPVKSAALMSQVRIIRTHSAIEGQLILVNADHILKGKVPDLELMPDDIVYVPDNWIEGWNQFVRAIAPTIQLAGGALQPFIQVKFLKGD
ncbi:sugar transferase [Kordiimonas sp. SCSIO 12603]|uniref:sugar transferase n=1 Tax=Kordiimonas sp. SCSIO 12603 TaxID=2829596 RepID=UPI0021057EBF|nr:sugar transferase [Kordiimonas sp. SCSIO 12603]UTW60186.1 sugar transferase [Kordiimonas sp. SCSIO 12603]